MIVIIIISIVSITSSSGWRCRSIYWSLVIHRPWNIHSVTHQKNQSSIWYGSVTFLPLTKTIHSQNKFPDCLLFFHSYLQVESSLTCPVGVTVAFREAQEITCSICCCTSTVPQYVTDTTQRLICCMWLQMWCWIVEQIQICASTREKGANRVRVHSAVAGENVDADMFFVEWRWARISNELKTPTLSFQWAPLLTKEKRHHYVSTHLPNHININSTFRALFYLFRYNCFKAQLSKHTVHSLPNI